MDQADVPQSVIDERARAACRGEHEAFMDLVNLCAESLQRIAVRRLGGPGLQARISSEDMVQETIAHAWAGIAALKHVSLPGFRAWLMMVHHDTISRRLRIELAEARNPALEEPPPRTSGAGIFVDRKAPSPSEPVRFNELQTRLLAALEGLSALQREVICLRFLEDRSYKEITAATGLSPGAIQGHLRRGLARLREQSGMDLQGLLTTFTRH